MALRILIFLRSQLFCRLSFNWDLSHEVVGLEEDQR